MPIDINHFREEKGGDVAALRASQAARSNKEKSALVDTIIVMDQEWRKLQHEVEQCRKKQAQMSKDIAPKAKAGEDVTELKNAVKQLKLDEAAMNLKVDETKKSLDSKVSQIGNFVHESVPIGDDEDKYNRVESTWGKCRESTKDLMHHHQLMEMIDGYESQRGVNVAGHRAYFLKGVGVLLNQALINFGLSFLMKKQYTALQPPFFMKKEVMAQTAQLEEFDEALYKVSGSDAGDMYLIATSEQPISAMHKDEWLVDEQLPIRYAGISTCFRKEAGSHGRDAWGIFRIHQFEKVEQFVITSPENSWKMHDEMVKISEEFYQALGLPYRVIAICSGALNNAAAKKLDLEAWFPTIGVFRELVSCSNCTDYQSRAMETRFGMKKMNQQKKEYVHMLNGTLCATERTICCILENYQTEEGVVIPEVLRPFMGGMEIMKFVKKSTIEINAKLPAKGAAASASATPAATPEVPKK